MSHDPALNEVLRELAPQVLASLLRGSTDFATAEDAVQEAMLAAARQWPAQGWPDNPKAWLVTVASRRRIELWRNESARRDREDLVAHATAPPSGIDDGEQAGGWDDTLHLLVLCCHPSITTLSQIAITLRAVGGLTTSEIARALLVPESTVAQRISRAKATIKSAGARFGAPTAEELPVRLAAVRHVLYLVFNEGYLVSAGDHASRPDLSSEALRLARQLHDLLPDDGETTGLLALMLLTDARRAARTTADGGLVALAEQERSFWNRVQITEGTALLAGALARSLIGPYQLQAAIAALHDEADQYSATDWPQILALYEHLDALAPGPMVTLNRLVAHAMVHGAPAALAALDTTRASDTVLDRHPRVVAVRAHLLEMTGARSEAHAEYLRAAAVSLNLAEQRALRRRAIALAPE